MFGLGSHHSRGGGCLWLTFPPYCGSSLNCQQQLFNYWVHCLCVCSVCIVSMCVCIQLVAQSYKLWCSTYSMYMCMGTLPGNLNPQQIFDKATKYCIGKHQKYWYMDYIFLHWEWMPALAIQSLAIGRMRHFIGYHSFIQCKWGVLI